MRILVLAAAMLVLTGCASRPERAGVCDAARLVLMPLISAAIENGHEVEIETRTSLTPPPSDEGAWRQIREFGFVPVWRSDATEAALQRAYWRAWRDLPQAMRSRRPQEADRLAWAAAYAQVGDDRVSPDDAVWESFFRRNRGQNRFACAAELAQASGARLMRPEMPRAPNAVRFSPAALGLDGDWALMAAQAAYPPLEAGDEARETGTIWLMSLRAGGQWSLFSARRIESPE